MIQKFTILAMLLLLTTSIFAQQIEYKVKNKMDGNNFLYSFKIDEESIGHHPHTRNLEIKQTAQLKSSQTIKHQLDSSVFRAWNDTTKLWTNYSKRVNTYNSNGNNSQSIGYVWVEATGTWISDWKSEIRYNINQNVSQYLVYDWDKATNQWIPDYKNVYSYNDDGTMPQILQHDWDIKTSQWVLSWKTIYTYNANGDLIQYIDYYWDVNTFFWIPAWKYIYSFNAKGQQTLQLEYFQDENTSEWIADSKIEYFYDENENMSEYRVYNRNQVTDQLELDWKRVYTYDNRYYHTDIISYLSSFWQNHLLIGQLTSMWNKSTNTWDYPIYNNTYYYSELNITSANSLNLKLSKIYPNPASEYIQFEFTGTNRHGIFELFDLQGRMVLSENVLSGEKLDVQQLTKGVYLYNIITNENRQSGKLIKQ